MNIERFAMELKRVFHGTELNYSKISWGVMHGKKAFRQSFFPVNSSALSGMVESRKSPAGRQEEKKQMKGGRNECRLFGN